MTVAGDDCRQTGTVLDSNYRVLSEKGTGIGVGNVNQRLRKLFGPKYGLSITSEQGTGTTIVITLPLMSGGNRHAKTTKSDYCWWRILDLDTLQEILHDLDIEVLEICHDGGRCLAGDEFSPDIVFLISICLAARGSKLPGSYARQTMRLWLYSFPLMTTMH